VRVRVRLVSYQDGHFPPPRNVEKQAQKCVSTAKTVAKAQCIKAFKTTAKLKLKLKLKSHCSGPPQHVVKIVGADISSKRPPRGVTSWQTSFCH
jgi:hypothetical protein